MTAIEARSDDYTMGRTAAEYDRLRKQARVLEPATRRALERVGICAGMSCLDVGCGPGEVMRLMGELVALPGGSWVWTSTGRWGLRRSQRYVQPALRDSNSSRAMPPA